MRKDYIEAKFYKTQSNRDVVVDEIRCLAERDRKIIGGDIRLAQKRFPLGAPIVKPLGKGLYEVRSTISGPREFRCLFFHSSLSDCLIFVHAFVKKSQATPKPAIELARARIAEVQKIEVERGNDNSR